MGKFDIGDYCYFIDHEGGTVERFKLVSTYRSERDGVDNFLLVNGDCMSVVCAEVLRDLFMTAEEIYKCVCGEEVA